MSKLKYAIVFSIIFFGVLFFAKSSWAATYYASPTGSGSTCSLSSPCSLNTGVGKLVAGDTLYLRGGTYVQTVSVDNSGTASSPITISGYSGETAVIDGQDTLPTSYWGTLFNVGGDYVVVRDLTVQNSNWEGLVLSGRYDRALNVKSYKHMEGGMLVQGDYSLVEGCEIWWNAKRNEPPGSPYPGGGWASGLSAARHPQHVTLRNNKSWNNWGEGISTFEAEYTTIEDNVVWDNWATNIYLSDTKYTVLQRNLIYCTPGNPISGKGGSEVGILIGDEKYNPPSSDNKIINNFVKGCKRNLYSWVGGLVNVLIAHNTFVNAMSSAETNFKILSGAHVNTRIENNIIEQDDSMPVASIDSTSGLTFSNNLWSKTPSGGSGTGDVIGDPKLAKTGSTAAGQLTADWFKLLSTSPAINKAKVISEVTEDFFKTARGSSPDIGGHEYVSGGGDTTPPAPPTGVTIN